MRFLCLSLPPASGPLPRSHFLFPASDLSSFRSRQSGLDVLARGGCFFLRRSDGASSPALTPTCPQQLPVSLWGCRGPGLLKTACGGRSVGAMQAWTAEARTVEARTAEARTVEAGSLFSAPFCSHLSTGQNPTRAPRSPGSSFDLGSFLLHPRGCEPLVQQDQWCRALTATKVLVSSLSGTSSSAGAARTKCHRPCDLNDRR